MTEKRTKTIKIRVTEAEHEALQHNSTKAQLAEWMRDTCLHLQGDFVAQSQGPVSRADPELLRQLKGIGNNVNQIARALNSGEGFENMALLAKLAVIEQHLRALRDDS